MAVALFRAGIEFVSSFMKNVPSSLHEALGLRWGVNREGFAFSTIKKFHIYSIKNGQKRKLKRMIVFPSITDRNSR